MRICFPNVNKARFALALVDRWFAPDMWSRGMLICITNLNNLVNTRKNDTDGVAEFVRTLRIRPPF